MRKIRKNTSHHYGGIAAVFLKCMLFGGFCTSWCSGIVFLFLVIPNKVNGGMGPLHMGLPGVISPRTKWRDMGPYWQLVRGPTLKWFGWIFKLPENSRVFITKHHQKTKKQKLKTTLGFWSSWILFRNNLFLFLVARDLSFGLVTSCKWSYN